LALPGLGAERSARKLRQANNVWTVTWPFRSPAMSEVKPPTPAQNMTAELPGGSVSGPTTVIVRSAIAAMVGRTIAILPQRIAAIETLVYRIAVIGNRGQRIAAMMTRTIVAGGAGVVIDEEAAVIGDRATVIGLTSHS
jgi:hypothetical protein